MQQPLSVLIALYIVYAGIFIYLEYRETSVMLHHDRQLDFDSYDGGFISVQLLKLMFFVRLHIVYVFECYFLMITVSMYLQFSSPSFKSTLN